MLRERRQIRPQYQRHVFYVEVSIHPRMLFFLIGIASFCSLAANGKKDPFHVQKRSTLGWLGKLKPDVLSNLCDKSDHRHNR